MNQGGGSRCDGHLWAGMGDPSLWDAPPLSPVETGLAPSLRELGAPSKSYEHRFWFELNPPRFLHAVLNFIFQADNVTRLRVSAVDQRQRMFARNPGRSQRVALRESRVLHQPGCGNFALRIEGGVAGNLESRGFGALGQVFELRLVEHGVLEKRSGAARIVVSRDNQHTLTPPYFAHRLAGFGERWWRCLFRKVLLQIGIFETRSATPLHPVVHSQDDVC